MAQTNAYRKFIGPVGSSTDEQFLINQSSPTWVLTFVRWNVRDTIRAVTQTAGNADLLSVRQPLVVENDCIQCAVVMNKAVLTHSMNATLVETDINYSTSIAPGDFVFVNMLNWEVDARRIVNIARSKNIGPINGPNDGFKGVFKIQSVRKSVIVDPDSGVKRLLIKITGFSHTEFNNMIYFNPYLSRDNQGSDKDQELFPINLGTDYAQLISPTNKPYCQDLIKALINSFIGVGVSDRGATSAGGSPITANTHFYIPQQIGTFLGVSGVTAAKDIYNYYFGIQQYISNSIASLATGMNPSNLSAPQNRFYYTNTFCLGQTLLKPEYWNQVNAWSIINQYTNAPINELYTCFRISPEGRVMPTVVFRQIPFTSDAFGKDPFNTTANVTMFLNLPRWVISSALILGTDIGREEAARTNFVQFYVSPASDITKQDAYIAAQTASGNFAYDINDVKRSGLRPYIVQTSFQDYTILNNQYIGRTCALILADAVIGGHLKMNGTIECVGIVDPITVGDNFEYEGTVFHIEEVSHSCNINPTLGTKIFRTVLKLSHGVAVNTASTGPAYAEMVHTNAYRDRLANFNDLDQAFPGIAEEQDVSYRPTNPAPTTSDINRPDAPFAQPGQVIKPLVDRGDGDSGNE